MLRLVAVVGFCAIAWTGAHAAPFGFSKDTPLSDLGCEASGAERYIGDAYTCRIPEAAPFFPALEVNHLPKTGICRVHGAVSINDTPAGEKTKEFFERLARYTESVEGEAIQSVDKIDETVTFQHSEEWIPSIAEGARQVQMTWSFAGSNRSDGLQKIAIDVGAFGDTVGKVALTMEFTGWPSCLVPPPPPPPPPPVRYTIKEINPADIK